MYPVMLGLHVLAAALWLGTLLVLVCAVLPRASREGAPHWVLAHEHSVGRLAGTALLALVVSGLWLAHHLVPDWSRVLHLQGAMATAIGWKCALTAVCASGWGYVRLSDLSRLRSQGLGRLRWWMVSLLGATLVLGALGISFRWGGLG